MSSQDVEVGLRQRNTDDDVNEYHEGRCSTAPTKWTKADSIMHKTGVVLHGLQACFLLIIVVMLGYGVGILNKWYHT